jgi:hypothetical protein
MNQGMDEAQLFDRPGRQHKRIEIGLTHGAVEAVDGEGNGQPGIDQRTHAGGIVGIEIHHCLQFRRGNAGADRDAE